MLFSDTTNITLGIYPHSGGFFIQDVHRIIIIIIITEICHNIAVFNTVICSKLAANWLLILTLHWAITKDIVVDVILIVK